MSPSREDLPGEGVLTHIRQLVAHKGDAMEVLLRQVLASPEASADGEIRRLLNHVLVSNRFWCALIRGTPFDVTREAVIDLEPGELPGAFREVQTAEMAWLEAASEADAVRQLRDPLIPGGACSVAEAFTQVCLHTHGHRAQVMTMLRRHGVTPVAHDFIVWLSDRARSTDPRPTPAAAAGLG